MKCPSCGGRGTINQVVIRAPAASLPKKVARPHDFSPLHQEILQLVAAQLGVSSDIIDIDIPLGLQPIQFDDFDLLEVIMQIDERYPDAIGDKDLDAKTISVRHLAELASNRS